MKQSSKRYLIAAIIWTVVALFAMVVLFFYSNAAGFAKLSAMALIVLCIVGQWLRYRKMK